MQLYQDVCTLEHVLWYITFLILASLNHSVRLKPDLFKVRKWIQVSASFLTVRWYSWNMLWILKLYLWGKWGKRRTKRKRANYFLKRSYYKTEGMFHMVCWWCYHWQNQIISEPHVWINLESEALLREAKSLTELV